MIAPSGNGRMIVDARAAIRHHSVRAHYLAASARADIRRNRMATQLDPIEGTAQASPKLAPAKGLLILGAVAVVMGLFLALNYALGITQTWVAFIFTLFWGSEKLKFDKLFACVLGALTGLVVAYALQELLAAFGLAGLA